MPKYRTPFEKFTNPARLGEPLEFPTSKRTARNRIMKAGLSNMKGTYVPEDPVNSGLPTERLIRLWKRWGHGGFGLMLTGNVQVDPKHLEGPGNVVISKENESELRRTQMARWAQAAKADGGLALVQLSHSGRQTPTIVNPTPYSASDIQLNAKVYGREFGKPVPLTEPQIRTEVIDRFVYAAKAVKDAGFDGIELHGANGFLLAQFLSPSTNKRTDRYGGSAENRARIVLEIYDAIRREIPASTGFVIGVKLNSTDFQSDGLHVDDSAYIAELYDRTGFDFIELSGGSMENMATNFTPKESTAKREAYFVGFSEKIKPRVKRAKVYVTGGFRTVHGMVKAIDNGGTDGIGLARPTTAEPDVARKLVTGRVQSVALSHYEYNYPSGAMAAAIQMTKAGEKDFDEVRGEPSAGIPDFSTARAAWVFRHFLAAVMKFDFTVKALSKTMILKTVDS